MACGEFSLIARYFDRVKSARLDVETGIGDDCALLHIPEKNAGNQHRHRWRAITLTLPTSLIKRWR